MSKNELTKKDENTSLANLPDFGADAGVGNDITMEDLKIPFLNLLQALSPAVQKGTDNYIEGAEPGMILNKATEQLFSATEGISLVLASRKRSYTEWKPDRGGFAGEHEPTSRIVKNAMANAVKRNELFTEDGNSLEETFSLYAIQINDKGEPQGFVVIPFTSTKIKAWRSYFTKLDTARAGDRKLTDVAPLFAMAVKLTAKGEVNKKNQPYFNYDLQPLGEGMLESVLSPDSDGFKAAKALREAIEAGRAQADYDSHENASQGASEEEIAF